MGLSYAEERIDLAAALRWAARYDLNEGIDNHFTLRLPGVDELYLAHPHGLHWSEIAPADLIIVNPEGTVVEGEGDIETSSFCIHVPIHQARPDANCVLHTHMPYATALASTETGRLEMASQNALRFANRVAYDRTYNGVALAAAEGRRLAACLGPCTVLFMANHGVTVVGESVARAFDDLYFVEKACKVQVLAEATGRPLKLVPDDVVRETVQQMVADVTTNPMLHFTALKRMLAREAPEFAH